MSKAKDDGAALPFLDSLLLLLPKPPVFDCVLALTAKPAMGSEDDDDVVGMRRLPKGHCGVKAAAVHDSAMNSRVTAVKPNCLSVVTVVMVLNLGCSILVVVFVDDKRNRGELGDDVLVFVLWKRLVAAME
jgi:hypothetical protein